jgi:hypothetical protein
MCAQLTVCGVALREAWEEAGVSGHLIGQLGSGIALEPSLSNRAAVMDVFLLDVAELHPTWPESTHRDRRLVPSLKTATES